MSQDRRKFIRYEIPLEVEFKLLDDASEYNYGVTTNFSRSGLCFESRHNAAQLNSAFDLRIKLPDSDRLGSAVGDVVWKQEVGDKYLYGIKLIAMETEAKGIILDSAYNIWLDTMRG